MKHCPHSFVDAFTMIELLIVVACLGIVAALLLPVIARREARVSKVNCANNLKQLGVAFRTWALDNADKYPTQVSITNGGTMELIDSGTVYRHFQVMSNELSTPKILVCPYETRPESSIATTFASSVLSRLPYSVPFTGDTNVSYFVGVDAVDTFPSMFLSGDANIGLDGAPPKAGLRSFGTNSNMSWFQPRHERKGNIALADGSVQAFNSLELRKALTASGVTNRLAIPESP